MRYLSFIMLLMLTSASYAARQDAIFAGGCFWCMQADFDKLAGVTQTISGYDGGTLPNPTYEIVSGHDSGYSEVVKVSYDDSKVSYSQLVDYFLHHIDPTDAVGQFCDKGPQYTSKIFYLNEAQKQQATAQLAIIKPQLKTVYTTILPSTKFYPAEEYHQDYYKKNSTRYHFYRWNCGRDAKIKEVWNAK